MTNLNPDSTNRDDHGLGWVTLAEGVDMSRAWLSADTPQLFTAGQQAQNAQRRLQLAQQIQQVAAATESDRGQDPGGNPDDPRNGYVNIRIQWAETTRYEADFYVSPYSTDEQLWTEIGMVPDALRRTLDVTDADNSIVSIVDLDGDGIASVLERAISAGNTVSRPTGPRLPLPWTGQPPPATTWPRTCPASPIRTHCPSATRPGNCNTG
jgi:hypothetical protein